MARLAVLASVLLVLAGCNDLKKLMQGEASPDEQAKEHLARAQKAEAEGDDHAAIVEYEKVRTLLANDATSVAALGRLYARQGNDTAAVLSLRRAIELSNDPGARKELADLYIRQGKPEKAAEVLKDVTEGDGANDFDAQLKLCKTLRASGKADEALTLAKKLVGEHPDNGDALSALAEALLGKGQADDAAKLLDEAVSRKPGSVEVRLARARFLSDRNLHDKALNELERVDVSESGRADVTFTKAHELALLKRYEDASTVLNEFTTAHPNDVNGQAQLAWVELQAGDYERARAAAEAVLSRKPKDPRALFVRGRCLEEGKESERAIGAYQDVLKYDPGNTEALQRMWRLYEAQGAVPDAITSLETLYHSGSANQEEQFELARLYAETGLNSKRGLEIVRTAASFSPRPANLDEVRRKLEVNASKEHSGGGWGGGGGGGGVEVIKGRR